MTQGFFVDECHVAATGLDQERLVRGEQRAQLRVFRWRTERDVLQIRGFDACHPQLADRGPESVRHAGLIREGPEVSALLGQIEQQPHDQRGTDTFLGRLDPAFDEKWRAHLKRQIERRDEAKVQPVRTAKGNALAERPTDRMGGDDHPFGAGDVCAAEFRELLNEWIHQRVSNVCERTTRRARELEVPAKCTFGAGQSDATR